MKKTRLLSLLVLLPCLSFAAPTTSDGTTFTINVNNQWGKDATFVAYNWYGTEPTSNVQYAVNLKGTLPSGAMYKPFATITDASGSMTFGDDTGPPVTNTECQVKFDKAGTNLQVNNPADSTIFCSLSQVSATEWTVTLQPTGKTKK